MDLITTILASLSPKAADVYGAKAVESVIRVHQNQYPGSWQGWAIADMAPHIVAGLDSAAKEGETVPERIVLLFL